MSQASFSHSLREELLARLQEAKEHWQVGFYSLCLAAMRYSGKQLRFSTKQLGFAQLLQEQVQYLYGKSANLTEGKSQLSLVIDDEELIAKIRQDAREWANEREQQKQVEDLSEKELAEFSIILSELFLACGSIGSPRDSYQLEFSLQRRLALQFFQEIFKAVGLSMRSIRHQGYHVLYAKDGQRISDFLLLSGAHQSLLAFEDLRVEKDVLNQVNRMVNCDNANAQRVADSSAKQREAIRRLVQSGRWQELPEELQEVGTLRMKFPELSLAELGARLEPPLGKSGVNHRIKKLMREADLT